MVKWAESGVEDEISIGKILVYLFKWENKYMVKWAESGVENELSIGKILVYLFNGKINIW